MCYINTMTHSYKYCPNNNTILAALHETASDLHEAQLMDKQTLRQFDALCLTPVARHGLYFPAETRASARG